MKIEDFCQQYGGNVRSIKEVLRGWQFEEIDGLLQTLSNNRDQMIGSAVIAGDAIHGGTLLDDVPHEVKDAFARLLGEKADTYEEMRKLLHEHVRSNSGFLSLDDARVVGYKNYLMGQIGENVFKEHVGSAAELAPLGQEGWDVSVKQPNGIREYVQVKLYNDPSKVVDEMQEVQRKIAARTLTGVNDETIQNVYFAVPDDIKVGVQRIAEKRGVPTMLYDKTVPISSSDAGDWVTEGMSNVGPDQLEHFFVELLSGTAAVASVHAIVNGFLWYKGSKEFAAATAGTAANTAISMTGVGAGLAMEIFSNAVTLSGAVGIGTRLFIGRMARSRWSFAEFLSNSVAEGKARTAGLQNLPVSA